MTSEPQSRVSASFLHPEAPENLEGSVVPGFPVIGNQPTSGYPPAHGSFAGPICISSYTYFPPEQIDPVFLGARTGHEPILIHCGSCGYQGTSVIRGTRGWTFGMWTLMTFGIGALFPVGLDTQHFCPTCNKHLAVAKFM